MKFLKGKLKGFFSARITRRILLSAPGLAGMALIGLGVSFIYLPAGLIVSGLLLLLLDSRL